MTSTTKQPAGGTSQSAGTGRTEASGLPVEAFEFYEALALDNSRAWWQAHRDEYEAHVRAPMSSLLAELADEFGAGTLYRPYRDTRFSKDKTPIKDHQGALIQVEEGVGYYVQVSAEGLLVAGGWYMPRGQQLATFRAAVGEGHAQHVRGLVGALEQRGWQVDGRLLKTRPRGVPADHPDLDLLRMRALVASRTYPVDSWMGTSRLHTTVRRDWRALAPLVEWLGDHVGPAEDPSVPPE
jgi:uncharacterized protein (TIGR02453 family)